MKIFTSRRFSSLFMIIFMLQWKFNHGILHWILCGILTGVLPVKSGCSCRARFRLFSYLARIQLTDCELTTRVCLDGKTDLTSASLCGSPVITTDLYLRTNPSEIGIGLDNITGWDRIIPIPQNELLTTTILLNGFFFNMELKTGIDLANIGNSINVTDCDVYIGDNKEQPCSKCEACNNGKGVLFDCSNINLLQVTLVNATSVFVKLPIATECFKIPGFT